MERLQYIAAIPLICLLACGGQSSDDTAPDPGDSDSGQPGTNTGFAVSGTIQDYNTDETADGTGLCVSIVDPTGAIAGGKYVVLASTTANIDGTFEVTDIVTSSAFGILMLVASCDGDTSNVMYSASGIALESYQNLGGGDAIVDRTAWVIKDGYGGTLDTDLATAGYTGASLTTTGALIGYVDDNAEAPLDNATVSCDNCVAETFYWGEGETTFATAGATNTATNANAGAKWIIPGAPIFTYHADAEGYAFETLLAGTIAEMAVFVAFSAE